MPASDLVEVRADSGERSNALMADEIREAMAVI